MNFSSGWYVLYVKSHCERRVYNSILELHLKAFLPLIETIKKWSDRKKMILKPLFPSYVFVYVNTGLEFYTALSVNGACAFIRFGQEYATVKESEINTIKCLIEKKSNISITTDELLPKNGELKIVSEGLLNNLKCKVIKVRNVNKIVVRIESLRQSIIATVPLSSLKDNLLYS